MSSHDTASDSDSTAPQTNHINIHNHQTIQRPRVPHTSDPRGKPTWTDNVDVVVEHTEHTVVDSDNPYVSIISGESRKEWISSDTYTYVEEKR